jgi:hypothetical protein
MTYTDLLGLVLFTFMEPQTLVLISYFKLFSIGVYMNPNLNLTNSGFQPLAVVE